MLMVNWCSSACIVQAGHAGSFYVNTTIFMVWFNKNFSNSSQAPYGEVMGKTLVFAVYDFDRFSKHDAIGEVRLPVCQLDLASTTDKWKELQSIVGDGVVSRSHVFISSSELLLGSFWFSRHFRLVWL